MSEGRRGLLLGIAAYTMWGTFPLYWPLLEPAGSVEILAHRVVWSLLSMVVLVLVLRRGARIRAVVANPRVRWLLAAAAVVITLNWLTYIYGVTNGRVVETSLGYFINPLVTVLMGVVVLGETLRPRQWFAMAVALAAVVVLTLDYGRLPWVALVLAFSFGTYGLLKKTANTGAVESLTFEAALIAPLALGYLALLSARGESGFAAHGLDHALLLASTGLVTAIPLMCFTGAATRVPMVTLGLLQYLAPMLQFLLGVFWFHEEMPPGRWAGFALVWLALVLLTVESIGHRRRQLRDAAEACAI